MKASELRIGNLLTHDNGFITGSFTVNSIHISDLERDNYYAKEYKPIPLTEEWLVKFGFEEDIDSLVKSFKLFSIMYKYDSIYWWDGIDWASNLNIKYIHQLQNLYFALTGEELTLTNPL